MKKPPPAVYICGRGRFVALAYGRSDIMILETERLFLREMNQEDFSDLAQMLQKSPGNGSL